MDGYETILTRRSIRKYTDEEISENMIKELIEAGVSAPSAGNQQPWQFVILDDQKIFDEIIKIHPNSKMLKNAKKAILICGDLNLERHKGYWILDCAAVTQNILLAAHANGLGAVWLGVHPREQRMNGIIDLFNLPKHILPISLLSIGYPAETVVKPERFNQEKAHYEKW